MLKVLYRTAATWHRVIPDQGEAARILQLPFGCQHKDCPLIENTARSAGSAPPREIQLRHIANCLQADPAYARGVAKALGIPEAEIPA